MRMFFIAIVVIMLALLPIMAMASPVSIAQTDITVLHAATHSGPALKMVSAIAAGSENTFYVTTSDNDDLDDDEETAYACISDYFMIENA